MPDEDRSNPFAAPTLAGVMNGVVRNHTKLESLASTAEEIKHELRDNRHAMSRFATRDELHEHALQCPGNPRAERKRPPTSGGVRKLGMWALAQQRLGVVLSIFTLLSLVGGAWWWSVNTAASVREKLAQAEKQQKHRDEQIKSAVKTNLREVLKAIKEGD